MAGVFKIQKFENAREGGIRPGPDFDGGTETSLAEYPNRRSGSLAWQAN